MAKRVLKTPPKLQVALDFTDLDRAIKVAEESVLGGIDIIEAGTPLIKSEGLEAVRVLRKKFPKHTIVADMKIMDAGRIEVEAAAKAGANIIDVLGAASNPTIEECVEAAGNYSVKIMADLIAVKDVVERAKELEKLQVDYIAVHTGIDQQMRGLKPFAQLREVASAVNVPVAVAGGINSETIVDAVEAGAEIIIVGGAITKSTDVRKATQDLRKAISTKRRVKTTLFKRSSDIRSLLNKVSTANLSDAMYRSGDLRSLKAITPDIKMVGEAVTVRTLPGDWAKAVEAIDEAKPGDVIIIDAGGAAPAVWGELATHSSIQKKISGVVVDGAVRDTGEIKKLRFPVFARITTPTAGEPKGFGEIGCTMKVGGVVVRPGDWIVGDDDGVVVVPKEKAIDVANKAMDVLERENRIRKEIHAEKSTLSKVTHLLKWEKT